MKRVAVLILFLLLALASLASSEDVSVREQADQEITAKRSFYRVVLERSVEYSKALDLEPVHVDHLSYRRSPVVLVDTFAGSVAIVAKNLCNGPGWSFVLMARSRKGTAIGGGTTEAWLVDEEIHREIVEKLKAETEERP